jgi:hypothetical protein
MIGNGYVMRFHPQFIAAKWVAVLAALGGLLALAYVLHSFLGGGQETGASGEEAANPRRVQNNVVKLGEKLAESFGLKDTPATTARWRPRLTVYGRVVANPRATAEVRAPFAGTLRVNPDAWPRLGIQVGTNQVLASLDIRVSPEVRLDLLTKLHDAQARLKGAEKIVAIQKERVDRFKTASGQLSVADFDAARVQWIEATTQLATAQASVAEWKNALEQIDHLAEHKDAIWSYPLKPPLAGEVTELAVVPESVVEAGSLILRVADFHHLLVRLDIPLAALATGPPDPVELSALAAVPPALQGASNRPEPAPPTPWVKATLAGPAPQVDASSQTAGYWYEVKSTRKSKTSAGENVTLGAANTGSWRPGVFVKADVEIAGVKSVPAIAVPETALLYHQGRALVYVTLSPGRYERREVQVLGRVANRWLLTGDVRAGERVVYQRAQVLLSEEFRGVADND